MVSAVLLFGLGASIWVGCLAAEEPVYTNGTETTAALESETTSAALFNKGGGDDKNGGCHPQTVTTCGKHCPCEEYPHCPPPATITVTQPASTYTVTNTTTHYVTVSKTDTSTQINQYTSTKTAEHTSTEKSTLTNSYTTTSYYTTSFPVTITVSKCTPSPPVETDYGDEFRKRYAHEARHNDHEVCVISTTTKWQTTTYTTISTSPTTTTKTSTTVSSTTTTKTSVTTTVSTSLSTSTTVSSTTTTETSTTASPTTTTETSTTVSSTTTTEISVSVSPTTTTRISFTTITTTLPASTITLSGEVTTLPGVVTTITQTLPGQITTLPGEITTLPGQVTTLPGVVTTAISVVPPITTTVTQDGVTVTSVIPASTITIVQTVTQPGTTLPPVTLTATTCAAPSNSPGTAPVYNPASELTWGCPPGFVCSPPKPPGCKIWADSPADSFTCNPAYCIKSPVFPVVDWPENTTSYYPPTDGYFNLAPPAFGLSYDIFDADVVVTKVHHHKTTVTTGNWESQTSLSHFEATTAPPVSPTYRKRDEIPKEVLARKLLKRDDTIIPAVCFDICNDCYLEAQSTGKTPSLCADDSSFRGYYDGCQQCVGANTAQGKLTTKAYLVNKFAQFLNYCDAVPAIPVETPTAPPPQSVETTPPPVQTTPQAPPVTSSPPVPITPPSETSTSEADAVTPPPSSEITPPPSSEVAPPPSSEVVTPPPSSTTTPPAATTSPATAPANRKRASSLPALAFPLLVFLFFL